MKRFEKIRFLLTEKLTLYPILTGILFLVNELRNNAIFYTFEENVSLILIVGAFTLGVDCISRKLIRNKTKAALIAALFIFINLFFRDISLILTGQRLLINFDNLTTISHPVVIIIPLIFIVWIIFTFLVIRIKQIRTNINFYLNVLIVAFILVEITKALILPISQIKLADNKPFPVNPKLTAEQKPDIYYIILDSYTSSESLKKYWKYDNSAFEDSLKKLGFQIATKGESNYDSTPYCLASYLNSSALLLDTSKYHYNERNLLQLIRFNRLSDWLIANKYHCTNYALFDAFEEKRYYNFFIYNHFMGRTIWYVNFIKLNHFLNPSSNIPHTNLRIFNQLNLFAKGKAPKPNFIYAHIMMPHSPFTFNEKGKLYQTTDTLSDKRKYLGQLIYTTKLTLNTIHQILASSNRKPIIIIQGDHGFRFLEDTTRIEGAHEAHTILYAVYAPNVLNITNTFNPTNTFRNLIKKINH